ncbi:MAG: hypothetical protein V3V05_04170 [Pontiella sp.]
MRLENKNGQFDLQSTISGESGRHIFQARGTNFGSNIWLLMKGRALLFIVTPAGCRQQN